MSVETYGAHECRTYFVAETVYGTTPASPAMLGVNTEGVEPKIDPGLIKVMGIGSRDLQSLSAGMRKVSLKIPNALSGQSPISLIQHVQTLSSLSVQVLYYKGLWSSPSNILSFLHTGCKIDKVSVECHIEDVVKSTVELIGQNVTRATSLISGATYGDYAGAVAFNSSYVQKGAASGGSGVTLTDVTDWKFDIENNLKAVPVIQSGGSGLLLKYLRERHRKLSGELTMEFEGDSELQDLLADTEFSLLFGLGSTNTALFKYCKWEDFSPPTKIDELVSVKAKFLARDLWIS
jgi:hypothetical protein